MNMEANNGIFRRGHIPKGQTLKGYRQPYYDQPEDPQPFTKPRITRRIKGSRATGWIAGIKKPKSADQLDRYFDSTN